MPDDTGCHTSTDQARERACYIVCETGQRSPIGRPGAPQNAQERRVGYIAHMGQVE
jgi:hypothetical protein